MAMRYRFEENNRGDSDSSERKQNTEKKNITIRIKKRTLKICSALLIVLTVGIGLFFGQTRNIDGTWIRVADDNDLTGMVVKVENGQGTIIKSSTNNSVGYGFTEGQIKWYNIQKTGWGNYTFYDLVSEDYSMTTYYDNSISKMEVSLDGKRMTITVESGELEGRTGLYQEWEKE